MLKRISILSLIVVAALLLTACGGAAEPTAPPAEPTEAPEAVEPTEAPEAEPPAEEVQLVLARDMDLVTLDVHRSFEDTALLVENALYDQLVTIDPEEPSTILPMLAESWTISDDGLVYTFKLRSGVKFSSGNDLTADDVKFSFERLYNLQGNPWFFLAGMESVEVVDPLTVQITLESPAADFLARLTGIYVAVIDSKVAMENGATSGPDAQETDQAQAWLDENSAGTGPFMLDRWIRDQEVRLVANPYYWGDAPKVDSVLIRDMKDFTTQKQLLMQGDIDIAMNIDPDAVAELESTAGVVIETALANSQTYMGMTAGEDVQADLATNQALRQAISHAIDYDGINNELLAGLAVQPPSIVPIGFLSVDQVEPIPHDLEKAKQLMEEAGLADGIDLDLYYPNATYYGVDYSLVAQKLQSDMAEIGINVTLIPQDPTVFLPAYRAGELPWVISYWMPDWFDPSTQTDTMLIPNAVASKRLHYESERMAELSAAALATTDREERIRLYAEMQEQAQVDAHLLGMIQNRVVLAYRDNITHYAYHPVASIDLHLTEKK
jgi:peptide/nickel transport system substrate-binding protein